LVSVVIPCYQQAGWLPQAVDSCLAQTWTDVEIIVVDDGSSEDLAGILYSYGDRVRLIRQNNRGTAAARNTGLAGARGAFIKFLDADDWLLPHCIETQLKSIERLQGYLSVIGYRFHYDGASRFDEDIYPDFGRLSHALCYINTGPPHTFLFTTDSVRTIGGFRSCESVDRGHEDYDLICRLAAAGTEAVVLHTIGCVYRQHIRTTSTNYQRMQSTRLNAWLHYISLLLNGDPTADLLVHLLGGYAQRLQMGDFRYERIDMLEAVADRLNRQRSILPCKTAIELSQRLIALRKNLPHPRSDKEQQAFDRCLETIILLSDLGIDGLSIGPVTQLRPFQALLDLVYARIWADRSWSFRNVLLQKISKLPLSSVITKMRKLFL
jgi:glycosyltransferase involved in cell wall biosynthesis